MYASSIERIMYAESTVLLQSVEPFLVCYVFDGPSYFALKKLDQFTETLKAFPPVWDTLTEALHTRRFITEDEQVDVLVSEIFLSPVKGN